MTVHETYNNRIVGDVESGLISKGDVVSIVPTKVFNIFLNFGSYVYIISLYTILIIEQYEFYEIRNM